MTTIPILELLFALILSFLPEGSNKFTITAPSVTPEPITCVLQDDGTWKGSTEKGQVVFEGWKKKDMKIVKNPIAGKPQQDVDLSVWITLKDKKSLIKGKPVKVEKTESGVLFFTTSLGIFRVETDKTVNKTR